MHLGSLHSCRASTHAAMQAITAMTQVHARDPFSREQKRPERLEAYSVVGIMPLANVVSPNLIYGRQKEEQLAIT
jgi:hypothetical protein